MKRKTKIRCRITSDPAEKTFRKWLSMAGRVKGKVKDGYIIGWHYSYPSIKALRSGKFKIEQELNWDKWNADYYSQIK